MNYETGHSLQKDDVIKEGPALWKTLKFGVQRDCRLILRGYVAPFRLEVYHATVESNVGQVYSLEDVKRVKYCGRFEQNVSLKIQFCGSQHLYFTFLSVREAKEWMEAIQMHSLADLRHITMTNLKSDVILMPNGNCHLNGHYILDIAHDAIRISHAHDTTPCIVWPVHTIRFYGYKRKLFSIATASCSETGEGIFHFNALSCKESEFIYDCVAALVSRMIKVAATAVSSIHPHPLPGSVPILSDGSSVLYCRSDSCNNVESTSDNGFPSASPDDKTTFLLNCFYLKQMGMCMEKLGEGAPPQIYGLSQPRQELLEVFTPARNRPERLTGGAILYGPLNCGKHLLAEEVAFHWRATLLCIPAKCLLQLDREPDAGVKLVFNVAMAQVPCIVFIHHLEDILPSSSSSSSSSLLADDVNCARRILQQIEDVFWVRKTKGIGFIGTISDLSHVNLPLPSLHWMDRKIYVPPPCLKSRRQFFTEELHDLLKSDKSDTCLSRLSTETFGFDFIQMKDLCRDLRKVAVVDALDGESRNGRCDVMQIDGVRKVKQVLEENRLEQRRVYEEAGLNSARYFATMIRDRRQEPALFVVKLMANEALRGVSHCFMRISDSSVDLCDLDPSQTIVRWPLITIRRNTWTPLSLVLEFGRMSPTKAGELHFETIAAKTICEMITKTIKKLELDSRR